MLRHYYNDIIGQLFIAGIQSRSVLEKIIFRVWFLLFLFFATAFSLFAQKHFSLTVKLPQGIDAQKLEAWLENGKGVEKIKAQSTTGNQLILNGEFYSLFAAITLQYPPSSSVNGFANTFFIQEKPAAISFNLPGSPGAPFANYSLKNVINFKKEKNRSKHIAP